MSPLDMLKESVSALARCGGGVILTIPKGGTPKGFPRGELLNEVMRNGRIEKTSRYDPEKVLGWMIRCGLVEMRTEGKTIRFSLTQGNETT